MISLPAAPRLSAALAILAAFALSACGGPANVAQSPSGPPPEVVAMYQAVPDDDIVIPAVDPGYLTGTNHRQNVAYNGVEPGGTIVVDPYARQLYFVNGDGTAMRYGIAVGREGKGFFGDAVISRKAQWPGWTPTANMVRNDPITYGPYRHGMPGGLDNPLGARALYLYRGGRDTYYRIHGTNNASTIGRATSAGCIRLFNQDILDLYGRVDIGAPVHVRSYDESLYYEGEMVEGPTGLMIPFASLSPEVQAQIRAGQQPWPPFIAVSGVGPSGTLGSTTALQQNNVSDTYFYGGTASGT